jgi:hypothetical protein
MELIVILGVIVIALIVGIWATREKPVENALEVLDKSTPPAKPAANRQPKVVATTGKPKATKAKASPAKKPATKSKTTRTRKTDTK